MIKEPNFLEAMKKETQRLMNESSEIMHKIANQIPDMRNLRDELEVRTWAVANMQRLINIYEGFEE